MIRLVFDRGTIVAHGDDDESSVLAGIEGLTADSRTGGFRAPARCYRDIVRRLRRSGLDFDDTVRPPSDTSLGARFERTARPHQRDALEAWRRAGGRGVVVLPTGAGKTFVAEMAMARVDQPTLVIAPTIDLMHQWYGVLASDFSVPVGVVGGGEYDVRDLCVTTYDSAYLHAERWGGRFGMCVFDECHHLPGPSYAIAAESLAAPFRLGLTATPEREDGAEERLATLIGPVVHRSEITELAGSYLAQYDTHRIAVPLTEDERERYDSARAIYRNFVRAHRISFGSRDGWARFLMLTSRSADGRRAFRAYREQKTIPQRSENKILLLERLFARHRDERILVFTHENETVHAISRRYLVPAITHETKSKERLDTLRAFNSGELPIVVTSRVLNEGVDVPAASVAVVLSGSGSIREHVQRLGRILRPGPGKRAVLYEFVAADTAEEYTSDRRRRHVAYE